MREWTRMLERFVNLLFPAQCVGCDAVGSGVCDACLPPGTMQTRQLATVSVAALHRYDGVVRNAVLALKDGRRDVARALGERLGAIVPRDAVLVPVPTTWMRRLQRGLDGGEVLARTAAAMACVPVLNALRHRSGDAQRGRDRAARLRATNRFACVDTRVRGMNVVLIDDVVTTGATLEDCAATLRLAGARVERACVVATADPPGATAQRGVYGHP